MASNKNRVLCRMAFLVFCLGPTLFVFGLAGRGRLWGRNTVLLGPTLDDVEYELHRLTGLSAKVGGVEGLQPGVTRLSEVLFTDVETGQTIARLPQTDLAFTAEGLVVISEDVQLERLQPLVASLLERGLRSAAKTPTTRISSSLVTLHEAEITLRDWSLVVQPGRAEMQFALAGQAAETLIRVTIERIAAGESFKTRMRVETGGQPLPCKPWFGLFPFLKALGEQSAFTGLIWMEESGGEWTGEMEGRLQDVNLDRLVSDQLPHKLSGIAEVDLTRCLVREGRIVEIAALLKAGPGVISQSLLQAAKQSMRFAPSRRLAELQPELAELLPYETLNAAFAFSQDGLEIAGRADNQGTLLILKNPELRLYDDPKSATTIADFIRMLAPDSELQVPATRETNRLLRILPAPPAKAGADSKGPPRAHVRLGGGQ